MNAMILLTFSVSHGSSQLVRLEAESANLSGPVVASKAPGFSGTGYVTGFTHGNDWVTWKTVSKGGIFDVTVKYRTPGGEKGYVLKVNGRAQSSMFANSGEQFASAEAGKVELRAGENEVSIGAGWGYYDIDYVELRPSKPFPVPQKPPKRLSDPAATRQTQALFSRMVDLYGKATLTGQYDKAECDFVKEATGVLPAVAGGDLMDYSPSRVAISHETGDAVDKAQEGARRGQIVTLSWHWNAPTELIDKVIKDKNGRDLDARWYKGFYAYASTFDVEKALADPKSENYRLILRDIDAAAVQLRRFQDAGIPVLWRPLHEAEGKWFWWGAKGPEPLKKLWRLMFDRLTKTDGLHNLIWVFNSANPDWYPGDDVVDVMSVDQYPEDHTDPLTTSWKDLSTRFSGKKLLALAEFPGAPDIERMYRFGVRWSYFVSWVGDAGPKKTDSAVLRSTYRSKHSVNAP